MLGKPKCGRMWRRTTNVQSKTSKNHGAQVLSLPQGKNYIEMGHFHNLWAQIPHIDKWENEEA
jgi:hypothetical protein